MNEELKGKLKQAAIIGALALLASIVISSVIISPVVNALIRAGAAYGKGAAFVVSLINCVAVMFLALFVYCKFVAKTKLPVVPAVVAALVYFLVIRIIGTVPNVLSYIIRFVVSAAVGFGYLHITKIKAPEQAKANPVEPAPAAQPAYTQAPVQQAAPVYTQPPVVEDMDSLLTAVLNAIRPQLKAPMTAVLCEREQMSITNDNGEYDIRGFVNSQNSYGAMIATDFAVKARYYNGSWVINKVTVGKLAAKNYAKTFLSNYIAISIFVGIMGLLGYLLLTLIIG